MDQPKFKFTIFTPTYNRERVLHRVYESLLIQTFSNFEWLIIDDGSTDNTKQLVETWQNDPETWFSIRYYWQPNQHKKVAHNYAVKLAQGEFFLTFDSDDRCVPQALERFNYHWLQIPSDIRDKFSSIYVLCTDQSGYQIGNSFPGDTYFDSNTLDIFFKYKIRGEKWGVYRTSIMQEFPFPEEATKLPGLIMESLIWNKIAENYDTRFVNEKLRIYYTNHSLEKKSPVILKNQIKLNSLSNVYSLNIFLSSYFTYLKSDPITFIKFGALITRFYLHIESNTDLPYLPTGLKPKLLVLLLSPLGFILYLRDLLRERFGDS